MISYSSWRTGVFPDKDSVASLTAPVSQSNVGSSSHFQETTDSVVVPLLHWGINDEPQTLSLCLSVFVYVPTS